MLHLDMFDGARASLDQSMESFERIGDRFGLALAYRNYGNLHRLMQETRKAMEYLSKAIDIFRHLEDDFSLGDVEEDIARLHLATGDTDRALAAADRAIHHYSLVGASERMERTEQLREEICTKGISR